MAQCTAKSKRSGVRCKRYAMKGKKVCAMHGGKTPVGADLPQFIHGRYSKYLPDQLVTVYHSALRDKDLQSMNDEIALIDTRLATMLARAAGAAIDFRRWIRARDLFRSFRENTNRRRERAAIRALDKLGILLEEPVTDDGAWTDISELIEQRRKIVDTERRRLLDEDQVVSVERLMILVAAIVDIVRRNVVSREERAAVSNEVRRLVTGSSVDS